MIVVHHLNDSRSQRILWLLEELGLPYDIVHYQRDPKTKLAPPELLAIHPLGKAPVVDDDGLILAETGAMIEILLERHGGGRLSPPRGSDDWLDYIYWLHFAEGSAMPMSVMKLIFQVMPGRVPFLMRPVAKLIAQSAQSQLIDPALARQKAFMEASLQESGWFAGDAFTAADVIMSFPVETMAARGGLGDAPALQAWLQTIHARPAYQAALERGGPYAFA